MVWDSESSFEIALGGIAQLRFQGPFEKKLNDSLIVAKKRKYSDKTFLTISNWALLNGQKKRVLIFL